TVAQRCTDDPERFGCGPGPQSRGTVRAGPRRTDTDAATPLAAVWRESTRMLTFTSDQVPTRRSQVGNGFPGLRGALRGSRRDEAIRHGMRGRHPRLACMGARRARLA